MADEPLNPYAPPQEIDGLSPPTSPAHGRSLSEFNRPYHSARGKATQVVWATVILLVLQLMMFGSYCLQLRLMHGVLHIDDIDPISAADNARRQQSISVAVIISELACFVALLIWIYATHANLPSLSSSKGYELEFTPAWAVGWFFVPLANLVRPYQVVREIARGSDPTYLQGSAPSGTALISCWWWLRVSARIFAQITTAIGRNTTTIEGWTQITWLALVLTVVVDVPQLVLQILMILKIQKQQEDRHSLIVAQPPPPPPGIDPNPFATFR